MPSFEVRPGKKVEAIDFGAVVTAEDFSNCRIEWTRAKKTIFRQCKFCSSQIKSSYFHQANFFECDFTGATIVDCNFRGARFKKCDFRYATIRGTAIDAKQVLNNVPSWENSRREFLRGMRKNAESQGETEDGRLFLLAEMDASAEHWRSAYRQVTAYYKEHYSGVRGRASSFAKFVGVKLSKWLWGYGESPLYLLCTLAIWLGLCTIWQRISVSVDASEPIAVSIRNTLLLFFSLEHSSDGVGESFLISITASRYIFLGLFAGVLFRRFARR